VSAPTSERHALEGKAVFLSASFPSGQRGDRVRPYDPEAIADAVVAVVRAVLHAGGRVVFGGHPTISPLVLLCASELGVKHHVDIFQTEFFEGAVPPETLMLDERGYGEVHWTPAVEEDREASLALMRDRMLDRDDVVAGVFIGGMEGIAGEAALFRERHPHAWVVPVDAPGGAARRVTASEELPSQLYEMLASDRYPLVAWRLVRELADRRLGD
jgi:hypothetical protein